MGNLNLADTGLSQDGIIEAIKNSGLGGASLCFCGDSITDDSTSSTGWTDWGWACWFRRVAGDAVTLKKEDVFAVASMGTSHLLSVQLPQVLAGNFDICVTMIGTNDLGSAVDIMGNLETFYATLEANNITGVAIPIIPHSDGESMTDAIAKEAESVNAFLKERAKGSKFMRYVNVIDVVTDFTNGDAVSEYLRDGIHNTRVGASVIGQEVYSGVEDLVSGSQTEAVQTRNNTYDETLNPTGDWLLNGNLTGAGGILQNGATGIAPDEWQFRRSSGAATYSLNSSRKVIDGYGKLESLSIEFSGTGDSNLMTLTVGGNIPSGIVAGDVIEFSCYVDFSGLEGISWCALRGALGATQETDGGETSANGTAPSTLLGMKLSSILTYTNEATYEVRLQAGTVSAASLAGSIDVKKFRSGLSKAVKATGAGDLVYLVRETQTGGTPLSPPVITTERILLVNAIFKNIKINQMTNALIQQGDRELIANADVVLKLNDKIEQGSRKMYVVTNGPVEPAGVNLVYKCIVRDM